MKLHLVNDEKIINRTIDMFEEAFPGENLFVVTNRTKNFRIVKKQERVLSRTEFKQRQKEFQISEVYIHWLNNRKMEIVNQLNLANITVYWIIWGLDLYNPLIILRLYSSLNQR